MAISATATQVELRAAYEACLKLLPALQPYAQGDATPTKPGRFTDAEVVTLCTAMQTALTAVLA